MHLTESISSEKIPVPTRQPKIGRAHGVIFAIFYNFVVLPNASFLEKSEGC